MDTIKNENANIQMSNNLIELQYSSKIEKENFFNFIEKYIDNASNLHNSGFIHIHDLDFSYTRPNCLFHDVKKVLKDGLDVLYTKSKPANNLHTAISHIINIASFGQSHCAGGQGLPYLFAFLAPYATREEILKPLIDSGIIDNKEDIYNPKYDKIYMRELKQALQHFIFQANQISPSRGLQTIFLSITFTYNIPKLLEDYVIDYHPRYKGKKLKEFNKEHNLLIKIYLELLNEGDGIGKPFNFPNSIFILNSDDINYYDEEFINLLMENMNKYGNTYILNGLKYDEDCAVMGCRTFLKARTNLNKTFYDDVLTTGNLSYITLNLPKIVIHGNLYDILQKSIQILLLRRMLIIKNYLNGLYPLFYNYDNYYRLENTTNSIGILGFYEVKEIIKYVAHNEELADNLLYTIYDFVNALNNYTYEELHDIFEIPICIDNISEKDYEKYFKNCQGRFSLMGSPAESCSYRLKQIDKKEYEELYKMLGIYEKEYYTNSIMVPEDKNLTGHEKILIESKYHPLLSGGIICHLWNATKPELINYLKQFEYFIKICKNTDVRYLTISNVIITCKDCNKTYIGTIDDNECLNCKSRNIIKQTKITGYLQDISNFNKGKIDETKRRNEFNL